MGIIYHSDYEKHIQHQGHPESPERLKATIARLKIEGLFNPLKPVPASDKELGLVHTQSYIEEIRNFGEGHYDMDTYIRPETFSIAALAAGGALLATKQSIDQKKPMFALLRPPGHHAGADYAGGFCYFNNAAIAAEWVSQQKKKVAIIDIDVHHGNGTSDIFYQRRDVLYISTHLYPFYPGTGAATDVGSGDGKGYTVNFPFYSGCGDASFKLAFDEVIEQIIFQFKPEMIIVSLGCDAHYRDTLGSLTLSTQGYIECAQKIIKMSNNKCAFMLEGGYDIEALAETITGIVGLFEDKQIKFKYTEVLDTDEIGREIVKRTKEIHKEYWKF